jgi:hypothetical protein
MGEILSPIRVFDYSALPAEVATQARAVTDRIRIRHQQQVAAILETGYDLLAIKQKVQHGQFCAWVQADGHRGSVGQISISHPTSTTWAAGTLKYAADCSAFRCRKPNKA